MCGKRGEIEGGKYQKGREGERGRDNIPVVFNNACERIKMARVKTEVEKARESEELWRERGMGRVSLHHTPN